MPHLLLLLLLSYANQALADDRQIELQSATGKLSGTLSLPIATTAVPVVLIVAGSGPTDRNGNSPLLAGKNDSLKMLAAALADAGFASVRYDKRGVAQSAAAAVAEADLRIEHYVDDARAWIDHLSKDRRFQRVAVIGHSEGSLIGMLAVHGTSAAAFVSVAGAGESAPAVLRRQLRDRLPPALTERNEAILQSLEAGKLWPDVPPQLLALYRPSVQPYLVSWFRYSPSAEIAKLAIPGLVVQGDTDIQGTVDDAKMLQTACKRCELRIVPGMNHIMKLVPADPKRQIASYGDPTLPLAPELGASIVKFLAAATKDASSSRRD